MKRTTIAALLFILGCTTTSTTTPGAAPQFKNLQVLPKDIPREQLLATMRGFTRGLGVKCNFCHVVAASEPKEQLDFPSDAKDEKRTARTMLRMTQDINHEWLTKVAADAPSQDRPTVTCWTCHRGKPQPEAPPAQPEK
ncbi:MAG TPA: c-type cytochrome [Thermoanaerobaculia bacterium]|nr:c-type cytochrome [Thermoanaerobaculia bacterium]